LPVEQLITLLSSAKIQEPQNAFRCHSFINRGSTSPLRATSTKLREVHCYIKSSHYLLSMHQENPAAGT
jgi:hypothetical protein